MDTYERQKVYDGFLRLIHAWNALSISCLLLTSWVSDLFEKGPGEKTLWLLHILLGYALLFGLSARLLWGIFGPKTARLSALWHPKAWWHSIRHLNFQETAPGKSYGHPPLAAGAYTLVYLLLLTMSVSGLFLAAIEHGLGPLSPIFHDQPAWKHFFKEPHEAGSYLLAGFILLHLAALILHEKKDKVPIAQSMVTGYQYKRIIEKREEKP